MVNSTDHRSSRDPGNLSTVSVRSGDSDLQVIYWVSRALLTSISLGSLRVDGEKHCTSFVGNEPAQGTNLRPFDAFAWNTSRKDPAQNSSFGQNRSRNRSLDEDEALRRRNHSPTHRGEHLESSSPQYMKMNACLCVCLSICL